MPLVVVAAIAAGGAVATGLIAATTVAMMGVGVSIAGRLTKSKELSQIGAGMSLGASVAGIGTSIFGGIDAAAGAGATAAAEAAGEVSQLEGLAGLDSTAGMSGATASLGESAANAGETTGLLGASDSIAQSAGMTDIASAPSTGTGILSAPATPAPLVATPSTGALDPNAVKAPWSPSTGATAADPFGMNTFGSGSIAPPAGTDQGSIAKWWGSLSDNTKQQVLGKAVGGLFDGWTEEQKRALERERLNLEKQKFDTSVSNANSQPKVAFKPFTPPTKGLLTPTPRT